MSSIFQEGIEYAGISAQTIQTLATTIIDMVHPVGSIYLTIDDTNPANLFGGTWVQITDGKYLVASGTYTDGTQGVHTYTKDTSGGDRELTCTGYANGNTQGHTLTSAQSGMPSHSHGAGTSGQKLLGTSSSGGGVSRTRINNGGGGSSGLWFVYSDNAIDRQSSTDSKSANASQAHSHSISNVPVSVNTVVEPRYYCVNVWKRTA